MPCLSAVALYQTLTDLQVRIKTAVMIFSFFLYWYWAFFNFTAKFAIQGHCANWQEWWRPEVAAYFLWTTHIWVILYTWCTETTCSPMLRVLVVAAAAAINVGCFYLGLLHLYLIVVLYFCYVEVSWSVANDVVSQRVHIIQLCVYFPCKSAAPTM